MSLLSAGSQPYRTTSLYTVASTAASIEKLADQFSLMAMQTSGQYVMLLIRPPAHPSTHRAEQKKLPLVYSFSVYQGKLFWQKSKTSLKRFVAQAGSIL